jgi:CheY-like chemotaxis protein
MVKILIAESDPKTSDFIRKSLEPKGYEITVSQNGLEALGIIHNSPPFNLVVLGADLPQINGLNLLDIIRNRYPQTMTILISTNNDPQKSLEYLKRGAYDTIEKPLRLDEIEKIVVSALNEGYLMKESGFIYKDKRRGDRSLIRRGMFLGISDSLLIGLSFYIGFLLYLLGDINRASFIPPAEIFLMSLGFSFSYAFIFVYRRSHRTDLFWSKKDLAMNLLWNISYTYILQLAILFLVKDTGFSEVRNAIGVGFFLGYITLLGSRLATPMVVSKLGREGRKTITFIGSRETESSTAQTTPLFSAQNGEPYIFDALSSSQISRLMDRIKGRKIKIINSESSLKSDNQTSQVTR